MDKSIIRSSTRREISDSNSSEAVEIDDVSVGVVKSKIENLKLNHQFNEKNVPEIFQTLINDRKKDLKSICMEFNESCCFLIFDEFGVLFERKKDSWTVRYVEEKTTIETADPEKSIIDHLWFALKNPDIKLKRLEISAVKDPDAENRRFQKMNSKKLNTLLQSMIDSIDHQIQTSHFIIGGFNEDTFFSLLRKIESGTLENIVFDILSGQRMKEIVETDQWKQAKQISTSRITPPLKIDNLLHCEKFSLIFDNITPEHVLRVTEHFFNSIDNKSCTLYFENRDFRINAIPDFLRSKIDGSRIIDFKPFSNVENFRCKIKKSDNFVFLEGCETYVTVKNY